MKGPLKPHDLNDRKGAVAAELERIALSEADSGRARLAKVTALRTLDRVNRRANVISPCPPDWHPNAGTEWEELDEVYLREHPEVRQRWWRNLFAEERA